MPAIAIRCHAFIRSNSRIGARSIGQISRGAARTCNRSGFPDAWLGDWQRTAPLVACRYGKSSACSGLFLRCSAAYRCRLPVLDGGHHPALHIAAVLWRERPVSAAVHRRKRPING